MEKRQQTIVEEPSGNVPWWYSSTAYIVKWVIVMGIILLILAWFTIGFWHAKRRMRQGLPLLRYHKFLVPQSQRYPQNNSGVYRPAYGMQNYPEPPPVYNNADMPPVYQPPPGGSKVSPQQAPPRASREQHQNPTIDQETGTV